MKQFSSKKVVKQTEVLVHIVKQIFFSFVGYLVEIQAVTYNHQLVYCLPFK